MKLRLSVLLSVVLAGMGLAAPKPPIQSTPNTTNISTGLPANNTVPTWDTANNRWTYQLPPGAGGGEANTMSNLGDPVGVGLYNSKLGVDLRLNNLNAGTGLGIASNANVVTISPAGNLADWVKITTNGMAPIVGGGTNLYGSLATKAEITAGGTNIYGMFATKADITSGGTNLYGALATKAEITAGGTNLYGSLSGKADITAGGTNLYGALAGKAPNTYAGVTNALGIFTGATTTYLRADGTMATPGGSGDMIADNVLTAGNPLVGNGTTHALATNALVLGGTNLVGAIAGKAEISAGGTNLYGSLAAKANIVDGGTNLYGALAGKAPNTYAGVTNALGNFTGSSTTFLRADGTMATPSGIGDVVADGSPWTSGYFMVAGTTDKHLYSTNVLTVTEADAGELVVTNTATAAQMSTVTNRMGYGIVTNDLSVSGALTGGGTNVWGAIAGKAEIVAGGTNLYGALATKAEITAGGTNIYGMFAAKANIVDGGTNLYGALAGKAPNTYAGVTNALGNFTGSTTTFLRADGTMATPPGSGATNIDYGSANAYTVTNLYLMGGLITLHPMRTLDVTQPPYNADRTGVADATAAIQAAIDAAGGLAYRPRIRIPSGNYSIVGTVLVDHTLTVEGDNATYDSQGTVLTKTGTGDAIKVTAAGSVIRGLYITCGGASNDRYGLELAAENIEVKNVRVYQARSAFILTSAWSSELDGLIATSSGDGMVISNECSAVAIRSAELSSCTNGIRFTGTAGSSGIVVDASRLQHNAYGVIITNAAVTGFQLRGAWCEDNTNYDCYFSETKSPRITGGIFATPGGTNVYLANVDGAIVMGMTISDNSCPISADAASGKLIYGGTYDSGGFGVAPVIGSTDYIKLADGAVTLGTTNVVGSLNAKANISDGGTNLYGAIALKADIASPTFTGTATAPTLAAATVTQGNVTTTNSITYPLTTSWTLVSDSTNYVADLSLPIIHFSMTTNMNFLHATNGTANFTANTMRSAQYILINSSGTNWTNTINTDWKRYGTKTSSPFYVTNGDWCRVVIQFAGPSTSQTNVHIAVAYENN